MRPLSVVALGAWRGPLLMASLHLIKLEGHRELALRPFFTALRPGLCAQEGQLRKAMERFFAEPEQVPGIILLLLISDIYMTNSTPSDDHASDSTLIIHPQKSEPQIEKPIVPEPESAEPSTDSTLVLPVQGTIPPKAIPAPEYNPDRTQPLPISSEPLPETRGPAAPTVVVQPLATSTQPIPLLRAEATPASETTLQPPPIPGAAPTPAAETTIQPIAVSTIAPSPDAAETAIQPLLHTFEERPSKGLPGWVWALFGAGGAILVGATIWFLIGDSDKPSSKIKESPESISTPTATPAAKEETTSAETPAALRPYLEKAREGDAKSMHMLAVMYYNGLNVRQNREEGLKWYRKAAEAGSNAARKELKQIEAMSGK